MLLAVISIMYFIINQHDLCDNNALWPNFISFAYQIIQVLFSNVENSIVRRFKSWNFSCPKTVEEGFVMAVVVMYDRELLH